MLDNTHSDDDTGRIILSAASSRLDIIASSSNVNRAYWEMMEFPTKGVILADHVSLKDYCALKDEYIRELASLKLDFVPEIDDPDWGSIIVRATKTNVHFAATVLIYDIATTFDRLLKQYRIQTGGEARIKDRLHPKHSRESDASIVVHSLNGRRIIAVLEAAYSESAKISEQEFEEDLKWYFESSDHINLVLEFM